MKNRTSKSASARPNASLPSGTSAPTAATDVSPPATKPKKRGRFGNVVIRLAEMNAEQFRQSLIAAGIVDQAGKLRKAYKKKPVTKS